ncbi:methionine--tRNA ligase [Aquirufa antheringensis]|uniref:Methionine--tRNA ligase n=1 Tax=Aquirufa antheringensis TaxID=2516559 RepID=A0A4Q9B9A8_9BACT|nr:methionine--tRNA ligase [Aquirufa antheringensis]MCZ2485783.1 methionine--tRNA ligase [Aquirufa antheringensis]MCZ2486525.1 methionine--tRNA ligase [Aquirufa antheringensis]MCZ2488694.1 methionine--tRNA ligase [Aquirufa antheringensis]TBH71234.1 methionine--tRNA ligase [Aquirufa antheringensis]
MSDFSRTTVTAALIYANGPIHIGHLAGCYLPADIYVRYLRLQKKDVIFVSGTDEHGVPITIKAAKEGKTPQQVVDYYYKEIKDSFEQFGISFDIYGRTSDPVHHEVSQEFFLKLYNEGKFIEEVTEQFYDEEAKQFLADRYITGDCPSCKQPGAYGDQCEKCGTTLSPTELLNPKSALSGSKPVLKPTKNWFLPLDQWQPELEKYINSHPEWKSNVTGQVKSWLQEGLKPRAMTRDLNWGVPIPLPDTEGKVLYVWFDAPIGYISMTKQLTPEWETYWKAKDSRIVHFIGKDNIVFHCLIFPAMCMAHGGYQLADQVPANEFMNLEGDKISTSRNWAVWLHEYLVDFPGKQDVLRYALTASSPETKDADFTWADFQTKNNSELVAILGNFVNRAFVLIDKNFDSVVPPKSEGTGLEADLMAAVAEIPAKLAVALENYKFRDALVLAMEIARLGNKYLAEAEPWKIMKEDPAKAGTVLNYAVQLVAQASIALEPFIPFSAQKLRTALGMESFEWSSIGDFEVIAAGTTLKNPGLLFEKIEDEAVQKQVDKLVQTKAQMELATKTVPALKETVAFDDFAKMDIRIGEIVAAEKMEKSKKLLKLQVNDGFVTRTILSGIAEHFAPGDLVGKQVTFLANLAPRKMMGIESEGMILMAEDADGSLALVQPNKQIWNGGAVN